MVRKISFAPRTLRGQITVIILLALVTIIITGRTLENLAKRDYVVPDLERAVEQVKTIARLLQGASPAEREAIVDSAHRSGLEVLLAPMSTVKQFTGSSDLQSVAEQIADLLFPPEGEPPLGGWRAFFGERRVIAEKVDDQTIVMLFGFPDTILTTSFLSQSTYYFIAVIVLLVFFFIFAIKMVTEPIKKISKAAINADINNSSQIFEERGSVEIMALARALNSMRNHIRLMMVGRTRMLRGISHDVRTPLTRLRLRVERTVGVESREPLLSDIDHMDRLLSESLIYLRDEYANEQVERVDVASVLQTVCSDFADVGFDLEYDGPNKLVANCRPISIARAVTNLCDNSTKFAKSVTVSLTENGRSFSISVRDDGPGVPENLRQKVFEPFFKVDSSRSALTGFGLGLSIVADIAHSHHGVVLLESNHPQGLVVKMDIPYFY